MLFTDEGGPRPGTVQAISQPGHALLSGDILAAWATRLDPGLVLAAAQHDVAWIDWERRPAFDPSTGRPRAFRTIGAAEHAPMWEQGVERALAAWGRRVALLISRHGSTIYQRFADRHRSPGSAQADDDRAAADYLRRHQALRHDWAGVLGLDPAQIEAEADLLTFADTLSLIVCGALPVPPTLDVADRTIAITTVAPDTYRLDPWPFAPDKLALETEARPLPPAGRFPNEPAMRAWLAGPARTTPHYHLVR